MCKHTHQQVRDEMTRRDLILRGGKAALGMALIPSFLRRLETAAVAAGNAPFAHVTVYFSQGCRFNHQFVQLGLNGASLPATAYAASGLNTALLSASGGINSTWGHPIAVTGGAGVGGIAIPAAITSLGKTYAAGTNVLGVAQQFVNANIPNTVKVVSFAAQHNDDGQKAVTAGQIVSSYLNTVHPTPLKYVTAPKMLGTDLSAVPGYTPTQISSVAAYQGLLGPVGPLSNLSVAQRGAMLGLAQSMSSRQAASMMSGGAANGASLANAVNTGYSTATTALGSVAALPDPRTDASIATPFGLTAASVPTSLAAIAGSLMKLVKDGQTNVIAISPNTGFDQHAVATDRGYVDIMTVFSQVIVPIIQVAVANQIPLWMDLTTDGTASMTTTIEAGVAAAGQQQGADNGARAQEISIIYNPASANPVTTFQVNGYDNNGVVLTRTATPSILGAAIPTSEQNTAIIRAASAIKMFTGNDVTGSSSVLALAKGQLIT